MIQRYGSLLGLGMAVSMVMLGGTALATSGPGPGPGPASGSGPASGPAPAPAPDLFIVSGLSVQSVQTVGLNTTVDVAITVYDTGKQGGTWEFPYKSIIGGNRNAFPTIQITNKATKTSLPSPMTASSLVSSPDPRINPGQSATAVYAFTVPTSQLGPLGDQFSIQLVPHHSGVFHMYQAIDSQVNTAPVDDPTPPINFVGQLPEVPLAAGLPLVALGTVGAFWVLRRNAHHRSAAQ